MLNEFEMANISPEIDTEKAMAYKKSLNLPDDAVVVFFHQIKDITETKKGGPKRVSTIRVEEEWGHYYIKNGKTYVGGYTPCMLDYNTIKLEKCRVMWPGVSTLMEAHQRFLLLMMRYKEKYGFQKLQKKVR